MIRDLAAFVSIATFLATLIVWLPFIGA